MSDDETTLVRVGERPVLQFRRHLRQPVEAVWRAVTDPDEMRSWFPTRIEIDEWKAGATLTHHFDGRAIDPLPGVVVEWDPPRRVRFTWGEDTIGFDLAPSQDGGTVLVLTEELSADHAARNAAGWESCLDQLEHRADGPSWQERFEHYVAAFEPVLGHQEGPPVGHPAPRAD